MLLQDGRKVGLGDIVLESTIAKDHDTVPVGCKFFVPCSDTESQGFDFCLSDVLNKAGDQRSSTNGAQRLARDGSGLDRYAKVEPQLEQQLVKDVVFAPVWFDVVNAVEQRLF